MKAVATWQKFWGRGEPGSLQGPVTFTGGDLPGRARSAALKLDARAFQLLPESTGHAATKEGRDLGADVELVGPGEAFERWRKTPDYQQWLKATGQAGAK
jgi:hypothetical protein